MLNLIYLLYDNIQKLFSIPDETIKCQHILNVYNAKFVTINRFMHIDQMKVIMCRLDTLDILQPNRTDSNEKKVKIEYDGETFYLHRRNY